ncbi:ThuA domain-containing protein [Planctomicrobium sp. SH661]|uniref:ThuA domain-containing protein n=1 Tax=Planctomicrobium sp. SH661 TaxID=3448124 RepID=UPI003F5BE8C3
MRFRLALRLWCSLVFAPTLIFASDDLTLHLRSRERVAEGANRFHTVTKTATWDPKETAIIVCDMWDTHTCPNAAARVAEMAPRMNEVLKAARAKGMLIIHAPSDTMKFYQDHPARLRARSAPVVESPQPLESWRYLDVELEAPLPIDDTDGGCDCERTWKPGDPAPWTRQIETLDIEDEDAITDSAEAYYLLRQTGIKNVIEMGVHTNMCVLGRPFSIRQLVAQGINVALVRDLTDSMYNPERAPFVSHFTGTDLVIEHIETYWCPTLLSTDLIGGEEFRFAGDRRPHLVIVQGEKEYQTAETLPTFAITKLGKDYRVSFVWLDEKSNATFPGINAVDDADLLLISARRRPLPAEELAVLKKFVAAGKPVLGIRTASHAFHLRDQPAPKGLADWPDLDATVFGGHYTNHYEHGKPPFIQPVPEAVGHPILDGISAAGVQGHGGLYQTSPLQPGATPLLTGRISGIEKSEPVAWIFQRADGGKSFYTSMGHREDFNDPAFVLLLKNAIDWMAKRSP